MNNLQTNKLKIKMYSEKQIITSIIKTIMSQDSFFISGHEKPDGDTVGSSIALASMLHRMGKKVEIFCGDPVPDYLCFLKGSNKITFSRKIEKNYDCAILLECVDFNRMGNLIRPEQASKIINIDHHHNYGSYGNINYVNPLASSSAEQIYNIFRQMKMNILKHEAEALYAGLVTDTGKFQNSNTTPNAMIMAAHLLGVGVDPAKLFDKLYAIKSIPSLKLLAASLSTLKTAVGGKVAYIKITRKMYKMTESSAADTEGIINNLMMIPSVSVGVVFRETDSPGVIKISLRSRENFDVNKICKVFGGGGHKKAAGCSFNGSINTAEIVILKYSKSLLEENERIGRLA